MAVNHLYGTGILLSFRLDSTYQKVILITAVFLVPLGIMYVRWSGLIGAACAIVSSQILSFFLFNLSRRDLVAPKHREALLFPVFLGVIAVAPSSALHLSLWVSLIPLSGAYAYLLWRRKLEIRHFGS
jgi:hypothetical protein